MAAPNPTSFRSLDMLDQLKQEAPLYRAAARSAGAFDKSSVADYTEAMLTWWRTNGGSFPAWALAARIVFASSPNSWSTPRSKSRRLTGPNAKSVKMLPRQHFGAAVFARLQNSQNSQKPPAGGVPGR